MNAQILAKTVNKCIKRWSRARTKLVVAIDGHPGVGKTTLLKNLARHNNDVLSIHWDDFSLSRNVIRRRFRTATDKSRVFELHHNNYAAIKHLIETFRHSNSLYKTMTFDPASGKPTRLKVFDLS